MCGQNPNHCVTLDPRVNFQENIMLWHHNGSRRSAPFQDNTLK
jgi:hypothetical protein